MKNLIQTAFLLLLSIAATFAQSGGNFTITQSVIASGGGTSSGGNFTVESTIGQSLAGGLISNPPFNLFSGFWTPELAESGQRKQEKKTEQLLVALTGKQYPAEQFRSSSSEQNEQRKLKEEPLQTVTVTAPLLQSIAPSASFTVNLTVSDTTGEGILGYEFDLLYNQAVILPQTTPCDVSGTISNGRTAVCNAGIVGVLRVVVFGATPLSGSGTLLRLNFTAVGMAGNTSPLTFQNFVFNEGIPADVILDGSVVIVGPTPTPTLTPTPTATSTSRTVINNNNSSAGSLRQAILDAGPGDTIDFAANVRGTILLTGFEIEINKAINTNLTIKGPGAKVLGIESDFAFRIFRVQNGNIKISGLRISRGAADINDLVNLGGGIWVVEGANLSLENCWITENDRGGIFTMSDSSLSINNSLIAGNDGGGIVGAGLLNISNSTISDNLGEDGAGISWLNGTVTLTNVTVSGNEGFDSGGITINGATTSILNSTITNNGRASSPGNIGGLRIISGTTVNLKNTIVAGNLASTNAADIGGVVVSQGNNLIGDTTGGTGFIASDLVNVNPQLGGFANNGGATYTYSLLPTSPAINGGNNTGAPAADQRGVARPQGAAVDIGSYESGVIPRIFGKFVFVRASEIFSINADGSNKMQITTNTSGDDQPKWSSDGLKIVFVSDRDGVMNEIYTMNANGSSQTRLTTNSVADENPVWSPDGTKIAFARSGQIFVMDANGANIRQLTSNTFPGVKAHPSWSPAGTQIVFHNNRGFGDFRIELIASSCINCTDRQMLVNDLPPDNFDPIWSPDGITIAFSNDQIDFADHSEPRTFLLSR